jgi:hypothetical protein
MVTRATHASHPWRLREKHPVFHAPENTCPIRPSSSRPGSQAQLLPALPSGKVPSSSAAPFQST